MEPGAVIAHCFIEATSSDPEVNVEGQLTTYVAFEDGARASVYFGAMFGAVKRILEAFQPLFDSLP